MFKGSRFYIVLLAIVLLTAGCGSQLNVANKPGTTGGDGKKNVKGKSILVYSGAGLRKPLEELSKMFQAETAITVELTYGGSSQCTAQILTTEKGDVFLPGDVAELQPLTEKGKIELQKPVVLHIPVLAVPKGNPAKIKSLQDMAKQGVKVALGDPQSCPIGKVADKILKDQGLLEKVEPNIVVRTANVSELFTYLALQQADAAIIWEDNLLGNDKIEAVSVPEMTRYIKTVPVASLKCSRQPEAAAQFIDFVTSEKAMTVWEKWGFKPARRSIS